MTIFWVIVCASFFGLYLFYQENKKIENIFRRLAEKKGGTVTCGFISYPQWSFQHNNIEFFVSALNGDRGPFTYIQFYDDNFNKDHTYRVEGKNVATKLLHLRRKINLTKDFDCCFHLYSENDLFALRLFNKTLQQKLINMSEKHQLEIDCSQKKRFLFLLSIHNILTKEEDFEELINTAIFINERMLMSLNS
ncbi:hypothetical protein [Candidatus Uabimicrobium sp. HlEnr_7]|uniref:hypothetical protein n=1 Tax=Candidatus Uabimicrobium helgolandensis TaxID=3095367 RepID=UPI003558082D